MLRRLGPIFFILLFSPLIAGAQQAGLSNQGTDYWIAFMPNYLSPAESIRVTASSVSNDTIHCDFFGGSANPIDPRLAAVTAGVVQTFFQASTALTEERKPEMPEYKAIHVYGTSPFQLTGYSDEAASSDGYLALPTAMLDTEYIVACYYDDRYASIPDPLAGEFVVIAAFDSTRVTIHNVRADTRSDSVGTLSHAVGSTWSVLLRKGQTYLVQSRGTLFGEADLTGTEVTGDKPFGIVSGHQRTSVPIGAANDSKDNLLAMLLPPRRWGTTYASYSALHFTAGTILRVIAAQDQTMVTINGKVGAFLEHRGDYYDLENTFDAVVTSDGKRFQVLQYLYSSHYNGEQVPGDPSMDLVPAQSQYDTSIVFGLPGVSGVGQGLSWYLCLIGPSDALPNTTLNGKALNTYSLGGAHTFGDQNQYKGMVLQGLSTSKVYQLKCSTPISGWIMGLTDVKSYLLPIGGRYGFHSPDTVRPSIVGTISQDSLGYSIYFADTEYAATGLADVTVITDSGDVRYSVQSSNVIATSVPRLMPGTPRASAQVRMRDTTKDARIVAYAVDREGNSRVAEFLLKARPLYSDTSHPVDTSHPTDTTHHDTTSSVRQHYDALRIQLTPNPASAVLQIDGFDPTIFNEVKIYDMLGRCVLQTSIAQPRVDVSTLAAGQYVVVIQGPRGYWNAPLLIRR